MLKEAYMKPDFVRSDGGREMLGDLYGLADRLDRGDRSAWAEFDEAQEALDEANEDFLVRPVVDRTPRQDADRAAVRTGQRKEKP